MVPVLKVEFLRIIRIARHCIKRFPGCGVSLSLLAFLGHKLNTWWSFWLGKFGRPKPAERPFLRTEASSYSVSGGSRVAKEYVVAASSVPPSASHQSLHDQQTERQPATLTQTVGIDPPVLSSQSVDHPYVSDPPGGPHLPQPLGGRSPLNRSAGNLSTVSILSTSSDRYSVITNSRESTRALGQPSRHRRSSGISIHSSASDRYSIIANSRESIRTPLDGPSRRTTYPLVGRGTARDRARSRERPSRAPHHQFGRGPDPSRSRERPTRPSTPASRPHTPTRPPRLELSTALPSTHGDGRLDSVVQPSASSSYTHEPLSPPPMSEIRRRQSSTIIIDIQNPSTESLPIPSPTYPPQITEEPSAMDSSVDLHDESTPGSPTSSNQTLDDLIWPEGRLVQLINSDQIPRYEKNVKMQVSYTILPLRPYICLQIPRGDSLRSETLNNRIPLVRCNLNDVVQLK